MLVNFTEMGDQLLLESEEDEAAALEQVYHFEAIVTLIATSSRLVLSQA